MANVFEAVMNAHTPISAAPFTMDEIAMAFGNLSDEDQVRFLSALSDKMSMDTDDLHSSLRGLAEQASNFTATDNYYDMLAADEIYPFQMHSKLARDLYRADRDGRLDRALARAQSLTPAGS